MAEARPMNPDLLRGIGGKEGFDALAKRIEKVCRAQLKQRREARPQPVAFSQGDYDCLTRELPMMISDAIARTTVLERALELSEQHTASLIARCDELQRRVAALEAAQRVSRKS